MLFRLLASAAASVLVLVCAVALATTPGTSGRINFRRWLNADHSRSAFFTMNPDGTAVRQISSPFHGGHDDQADWSPDGARLAFARFPDNGPASVVLANADGSNAHQIRPRCQKHVGPNGIPAGCEDDANPSFTPDGAHLTFARATGRVRHF